MKLVEGSHRVGLLFAQRELGAIIAGSTASRQDFEMPLDNMPWPLLDEQAEFAATLTALHYQSATSPEPVPTLEIVGGRRRRHFAMATMLVWSMRGLVQAEHEGVGDTIALYTAGLAELSAVAETVQKTDRLNGIDVVRFGIPGESNGPLVEREAVIKQVRGLLPNLISPAG